MRERLIGAAVLVIIAVILIPWLVSRAHHPQDEVVTRTAWPASASAPAQPYVLPLGGATTTGSAGRLPATSRGAATTAVAVQPPPPKTAAPQPQPISGSPQAGGQRPGSSAPDSGPSQAAMDSGWSIQAASFSDLDAARTLAMRLRQAGFEVGLAPHQVGTTTYYRVRVGPYPSEARARAAAPGVARISKTQVLVRSPGNGKG